MKLLILKQTQFQNKKCHKHKKYIYSNLFKCEMNGKHFAF